MARRRAEAELGRIATHFTAIAGLAARHVESGRALALNDTTMFPFASTVKVPIALAVLAAVDAGRMSLSQMVEVGATEFNPSGPLGEEFLHPGVMLSVHNLLEPMITRSDNTATDVLLRLIGGPEAVQRHVTALGVAGMRIDRTIRDLLQVLYRIRVPDNASVAETLRRAGGAASRAADALAPNPLWRDDPRDHTTPAAMLDIMCRIATADGVSDAARATLLPIMGRTSTGLRRLRGRLPPGVAVANKTGTAAGTTNDVGLITLPDGGGTVAIAVYVKDSPLPPERREDLIAELARTAYDHFLLVA